MIKRRGLSRALAVTSIVTAVATAGPATATASAATASPAATRQPAALSRPAARSGASLSPAARTGAGLSPAASWAAEARQAATAGHLNLPSLLLANAPGVTGARRTPALSAITGVLRGADGVALTGACVTASGLGHTVSVVSGAGGRYVLPSLRPGAYTISYQDCARPARYFEQWSGGADLASDAARVLVRASRPTRLAPVTLRLTSPAAEVAGTRAQTRPGQRASDAASRGAIISGVVRSRSGRPLANICAVASRTTGDSGAATGAGTGRHGGYSLPIGSAGRWLMTFASGCGNHGNYAPQWWRFASTPRKATYLHARPGRHFRDIDAALRPGASISGVVRSHRTGRPLGHVCVDAVGIGPMSQVQEQATTKADGSYRIQDLGTGRYRVAADGSCDPTGNYLGARYPRAVAVTDGKTTTGINIELDQGGAISGVVTSQASGARLAGVCVEMIRGSTAYFGATGRNGRYSFGHLDAGRYPVSFNGGCGSTGSYAPQFYDGQSNGSGATPVTVTAGAVRTGIDAAMLPGGTVTGRVTTSTGAGLANVCVVLVSRNYAGGLGQGPAAGLGFSGQAVESAGLAVATTSRAGSYRASNMTPGQYAAEFLPGCVSGHPHYGSQDFAPRGHRGTSWIWAGGGTVTAGVNTVLRPAGSIAGVITGARGRRLSGICALAIDPAVQGPASLAPEVTGGGVSRDGAYRITGLAAGRYRVAFDPCSGQSYALQWYRRQYSESAAAGVPVRTGRVTHGINGALLRGGTLTGRIVSSLTGRGASGVCVFVTDEAGQAVAGAGIFGGRYRIPNVPPGRWNLEPVPCVGSSPLAGIVYHAVRVRNEATHAVATIRLPEAGRLTGTVLGGTPSTAQPGICVEATPVAGDGQPGTAVTGPGGRYALGALAPGRYRVLFTPECLVGTATLVPQWFSGRPTAATATLVRVTAGRTVGGVGAQLAADGGIAGRVSSRGRAAAGVCVSAFAAGRLAPTALAITRAGGRYELDGLAPGRYQVEFTAGCGDSGYPAQWYQGAKTRGGAKTVTVTASSVTTGISEG